MKINKNALKRIAGYFGFGLLVILGFAAAEETGYKTGVTDGITFVPKLIKRFGENGEGLDENNPEDVEIVKNMFKDHTKLFQKGE